MDNQLKEYTRLRLGMDDSSFIGNLNHYFDMLQDKKLYIRTLLKARQLKLFVMMLDSKRPIPTSSIEFGRLMNNYNEDVQWKINLKWDEVQIGKLKQGQ